MSRLARARDTIVAYVSLLFGAGLSVGANLADTLRIRGHAVDTIDIALAVGPPLAALLVVELFVSAWPRTFSVQSVRWVATLIVGTLATIVSWIHIHELLAARGQNPYVAMLWPVAIDGLAIMAMAKLLVTRGHVASVAKPTLATYTATEEDVAISEAAFRGQDLATATATTQDGWAAMATQPDDPTIDLAKEAELAMARWNEGYELAIERVGQDVAKAAEALANGTPVPVVPGQAARVPDEARPVIEAMIRSEATPKEIDAAIVEMLSVSDRTARRYRAQVRKEMRDAS